ncbi:hypothetical protein [Neoaquamicrobium microcysteis]|uniref:hypothetical protein n=1 Tax=Neoaquamicrobium microcysteis TaxID=2682781 RepID=UPI00137573E1|nr:hypothetical protein [Mesorhizobium microcysteis]
MTYVSNPRHGRKTARIDADRTTVRNVGAVTYIAFALSVGFAAALIFGFLA